MAAVTTSALCATSKAYNNAHTPISVRKEGAAVSSFSSSCSFPNFRSSLRDHNSPALQDGNRPYRSHSILSRLIFRCLPSRLPNFVFAHSSVFAAAGASNSAPRAIKTASETLQPSDSNEEEEEEEQFYDKCMRLLQNVSEEDVEYIIQELEKNYPLKMRPNSTRNNTKLLLALGATNIQISKMFQRNPMLFSCNYKTDMIPTLTLLVKYGVTVDEILKALTVYSGLFKCPLKQMTEVLDFFRDEIKIQRLGKVVWGCPVILACPVKTLRERIEVLNEIGLTDSRKAIEQFPAILGLRANAVRKKAVHLGMIVNKKDVSGLVQAMPQLLGSSMKTVEETFGWLVERFGKDTVLEMIEGCPGVMNRRIANLSEKLDFVCNVMGRDLTELLRTPAVFNYSVKGRLLPRFRALQKLGLGNKYGLSYMFSPSNQSFCENFGINPIHISKDGANYLDQVDEEE